MSKVDIKWVLDHIQRIVEDPETTKKDALSALRMAGDYLKMFEHEKKVKVDVRNLVTRMPMDQLLKLTGTPTLEMEKVGETYSLVEGK